jgi:hypothetical protein
MGCLTSTGKVLSIYLSGAGFVGSHVHERRMAKQNCTIEKEER